MAGCWFHHRECCPDYLHISPVMKKLLLSLLFVMSAGLSACQCSDKPEIGPVEGQTSTAQVVSEPIA